MKRIQKTFIIMIAMCVLLGFVNLILYTEKITGIYSSYAVLMERSSGEIVKEKNKQKKMYPASMTKIMTCIVALEEISDLDRTVTISEDILKNVRMQGASVAGFEAGETVTLRDLLYGMMLPSGAECCLRIARYLAGSEEQMTEMMNEKAVQIGMNHTNFTNTTGLHDQNHYTTVEDMALLLNYALNNEQFREIFCTMSYQSSSTDIHSNGLLLNSTLSSYQDQMQLSNGTILGGKTGYTSQAGLCLASLAEINGKEYILVTGRADGDHNSKPYHLLDAGKIYEGIK
ncbi:MAG: serine hydrolase [Lachnospiraceae bacterium]|nr:serine hydrolase [Lachnospiraceae bacterium]